MNIRNRSISHAAFLGPSPDVDFVISICLQSNIPPASAKPSAPQQLPSGPVPSASDVSGSSKLRQTRDRQAGKRKGMESMSLFLSFMFCCANVSYDSLL